MSYAPRPQHLLSRIARIPKRVWLLLALTLLVLFALAVWAAVALLSHAWQSGGAWLDRGREAVGLTVPQTQEELQQAIAQQREALAAVAPEAQQQLEAMAPEVRERIERSREALAAVAPEAQQRLEAMAPEVRERIERSRDALAAIAPETAARLENAAPAVLGAGAGAAAALAGLPREDVPGEDIAELPRQPGFVRTGYALTDGKREVTYRGRVPFAEAMAAHRRALTDAGFDERVLRATPTELSAEYRRDGRVLALAVTAQGAATSEVRIAER